jgi:hypothetical protein
MEKLKKITNELIECVECEMSSDLKKVNTQELGEVIDMIKDLEDAMYHHSVVEAMHKGEGKVYHCDTVLECSCQNRHNYINSKVQHLDKAQQMTELEKYLTKIFEEMSEVIDYANTEEKQMVHQKITNFMSKLK